MSLLARVSLGGFPNLWHNQASLCITPYTPRSLHVTPLNHPLFSARLTARGLTLDSTIPLFSSRFNPSPKLPARSRSQGLAERGCQQAAGGGGAGALGCFTWQLNLKPAAAQPWLRDSWTGPSQSYWPIRPVWSHNPTGLLQHNDFFFSNNKLFNFKIRHLERLASNFTYSHEIETLACQIQYMEGPR